MLFYLVDKYVGSKNVTYIIVASPEGKNDQIS